MKKIYTIIFLIFSITYPVFAGQKNINWTKIWTSNDGVIWYYDSNSLKPMFFDNDFYGIAVKSYNNSNDETNYYTYCFECSPIAPLYWSKKYNKNKKVRWVGGQSAVPNINNISGNLYIEICGKDKLKQSDDRLPFNIKIKPPINFFNYDVDINDF